MGVAFATERTIKEKNKINKKIRKIIQLPKQLSVILLLNPPMSTAYLHPTVGL